MDDARDRLAAALGCRPRELTFTSGGTEADNLAVRGVVERWGAERGRHLVVSAIEHEAVLTTATALAERGDAEVTVVGCDSDGGVDYVAMELIRGRSLEQALSRGKLRPQGQRH